MLNSFRHRGLRSRYYFDNFYSKKLLKTVIRTSNSTGIARISNSVDECDFVGPPHKDANIRLIKFYKKDNETLLETIFRQKKEETQKWNIEFWSHHNIQFQKEKDLFIAEKLQEKYQDNHDEAEPKYLSAEEMSVFYHRFLEQNRQTHLNYNKEWYKKNFENLLLATRVLLQQICSRKKS